MLPKAARPRAALAALLGVAKAKLLAHITVGPRRGALFAALVESEVLVEVRLRLLLGNLGAGGRLFEDEGFLVEFLPRSSAQCKRAEGE